MIINKRKLLSILTAFVMAFTVFGCTSLSFAEGEDPDTMAAGTDEPVINEGDENAEVSTMSLQLDPPENDGSVAGLTSVTLKWTPVDPIDTGDPFQYWIYDSDAEGAEPIAKVEDPATTNPPTTWKKEDLTTGETYTFYVKAVELSDEDGSVLAESDLSSAISLTCKANPINAPSNIKVTSAYKKLTFTWAAVSKANGGTISYEIYESKSGKPVATKKADQRSFVKSGLSPRAKEYKAFIKAVEKDGSGNVIVESAWAELKGMPDGFQTRKMTGLVSDPGYKAVLLQWDKIDGATGYEIYWRKGGERGNIDTVGRDSDGHWMKTFRSKKTKKYVMPKKPGKYKHLATVKQPKSGKLVKFDKRDLDIMNHTYVYFYQFMIIPYFEDDQGRVYTSAAPGDQWESDYYNGTSNKVAAYSIPKHNIVRNNTVLPMYVYETAKVNKPIYKTCSMGDGKKRGRLHKGHKFICWDKANGRVKFYGKKDGSGQPGETYWFAQKNAHTIQGYYMDNCRYGGNTNLKRKDWKTGYSKKTVLDYVNHCGIKSKTKYFVWASKYAQHVYILKKASNGKWELLDGGTNRIPTNTKGCWSNLCASGKVNIQSRNGHYVIFGKQYKANRSAYDYYCLSKLHKTVRLHSLLYKNGKKFSSFKFKNKVLGNPISKGCIRLRPYAAQWIYKHVPKKTRTLVY